MPLAAPAALIGQARQLFACPLHESQRGLWFSAKANELARAEKLHQDVLKAGLTPTEGLTRALEKLRGAVPARSAAHHAPAMAVSSR